MLVGLVSDTHGHIDPHLAGLFAGCDAILHAGDIVKPSVLVALGAVAPVTAVRGNNDWDPAFAHLPEAALVPVEGLTVLVVHDLGARDRPRPPARAILAKQRPHVVVHGHSHKVGAALFQGALFVNPGSAGPRRFSLPRTAALLEVRGRSVRLELFDLGPERPERIGELLEASL